MNAEHYERQQRYEQNLRFGRELAKNLAIAADRIAVTLDRLAAMHEAVAESQQHPLAAEAANQAEAERLMAENERAASIWLRKIAAGSYRPVE